MKLHPHQNYAITHPQKTEGVYAMYGGGIYTDQKCVVCGRTLKDNFRDGLECPKHPQVRATRFRVQIKGVKRRFNNYGDAYGFLIARREQVKLETFDARDWAASRPLGLSNLVRKYVELRAREVRDIRHIKNHLGKCVDYFGQRNVKDITYGELEDFLFFLSERYETPSGQKLSSKSRKNIFISLHAFMVWCHKRRYIAQVPEFPEVKFELGWRNTVSKEIQQQIIAKVRELTTFNPKIWIGIKWLATYVAIRPGELIQIKEGDFDLENGIVNVKHNKEGQSKIIPLLPEDIELVRSFPVALPHLYFFRHTRRKGLTRFNREQFSCDYLWSQWRRATKSLGIQNIDLYGGTKHSTVRALREHFSPEQIKKFGTKHSSNAAFDRYFQYELQDSLDIYEVASSGKTLGKVLPLNERRKLLEEHG